MERNADCAAMRMSQAIASARPAPTAGPGRAAMVGLRTETSAPVRRRCRSCRSATRSSWDISSFFLSRFAPMPLTLPPAQNAVPAPVSSSTPTSGFSPQALIMLRKRRRQIIRHRVARLGAVQRDDGDAVADHAEQFVGAGVDFGFGGHGSPCCCCFVIAWAMRQSEACPPFDIASDARWWARRFAPLPTAMTVLVKTSPPTAATRPPRSRRCAAAAARSSSSTQSRRDRASSPAGRRVPRAPRCGCRRR